MFLFSYHKFSLLAYFDVKLTLVIMVSAFNGTHLWGVVPAQDSSAHTVEGLLPCLAVSVHEQPGPYSERIILCYIIVNLLRLTDISVRH
jgi:hypothetical protein